MTKPNTLLSILAALAFSLFITSSVFAAPLTASLTETYTSRLIEEGRHTGDATVLSNLTLGYSSFNVGVVVFNPTSIDTQAVHSHVSRVDVIGGYHFDSVLGTLTVGADYKSFNAAPKTDKTAEFEPFVKIQGAKYLPVYATARYNVATRNVNLEGGAQVTIPVGYGFGLTPSVYVGYNDSRDTFPRSTKAIKSENRYYGGELAIGRTVLGVDLAVGVFTNRANHLQANTTNGVAGSAAVRF